MPDANATPLSAVLDRLLRDGTAVAPADGRTHTLFPVGVNAELGSALRNRVMRERPETTIEIGLGYGISTLFILQGLEQVAADMSVTPHHLALDPFQERRFGNCGLQAIADAGWRDRVEHLPEESQFALPRLVQESRQFDLAFVDGNHRFDGVFLDLYYLGWLVRPGGAIFLDDYQLPAIAKAVAFFTQNRDWTLEEVGAPDMLHQWAVVRTCASPQQKPFDHFVDF